MADHDTHDHTGVPGVGTVPAGTSFPVTPSSGDQFFRTDLGMDFYYDGTRWLSTQVFSFGWFDHTGAIAGSTDYFQAPPYAGNSIDLWLVDFRVSYQVATTHSGTQYWQFQPRKYDNTTDAAIITVDTDKATTTFNNPAATAIGALLGTANKMIYLRTTKVSTPGNLLFGCELRYRLVGT